MNKVTGRLTVFFEDPFWVGVYEREEGGRLEAARVVFGAEPKDYQVLEYFLKYWSRLRFSPSVEADRQKRENPKRMQRAISRSLEPQGVGTKAQQALKLQQEQAKTERRTRSRQRSEQEKELRFEQRQQKKKEKHKGR